MPIRSEVTTVGCVDVAGAAGSWDTNLTDTEPGESVYDLAPCAASFAARGGPGFDLATWSAVTLTARIADRTTPMPDAATVKEAIAGHCTRILRTGLSDTFIRVTDSR